jgi:predicted nucleic acid-binding protein
VIGFPIRLSVNGFMNISRAQRIHLDAKNLLAKNEHDVDSNDVLELATQCGCTAYDCEYGGLAKRHNLKLVTADAKLIAAFPRIAHSLIR